MKKDKLVGAYLIALVAARDRNFEQDLDKTAFKMIRDLLADLIKADGGNTMIGIMATHRINESEIIQIIKKEMAYNVQNSI